MNELDMTDLGFGSPAATRSNQAAAIRALMMDATSTDPKQHSETMKVAKSLSLPTEIVKRVPKEKLPPMQSVDLQGLSENYPGTAKYLLSSPDHAKVSRDDLQNLMAVEKRLTEPDFEARGLFDNLTREKVVNYLKEQGYDIDIDNSVEIAKRRPANLASKNMPLLDQISASQIGAGFAEAIEGPAPSTRIELPTNPRDWMDATVEALERGKFVPYASVAADAADLVTMQQIARRAERDDMTHEDWAYLLKQDNQIRRGSTRAAGITDILANTPAFAGELATSMGVGTAASQGTKQAVKVGIHALRGALSKKFTLTAEKALLRSVGFRAGQAVVGGAARAAVQTGISSSARIAVETYRKMLPQFKGLSDEQALAEAGVLQAAFEESKYDFLSAFGRSFGEQYIEVATELVGLQVSKVYSWLADKSKLTALMSAVTARYLKLNPTKTLSQFAKELQQFGWDGVLTEWTEERIGDVARMALGWEEWGINGEQYLQELIAFSVMGGVAFGFQANRAYKSAKQAAESAQAQVDYFQSLADGSEQSQTRSLVPGLQALQAQMAAEYGPVQTLYFPLESWNGYWESKGLSGRAEAVKLGISEEEFDALSENNKGADLKIPIGQYIEFLAPSEHNEQLAQIARLFENAPNVQELREIVSDQISAHSSMTALMQLRRDTEIEQEKLETETKLMQEELANLAASVGQLSSPESVAQIQQAILGATTEQERAELQTKLASIGEMQAKSEQLQLDIADKLKRIEEVNKRLTDIRRQELSFSQAGITEASETKALADRLFTELQSAFSGTQNKIGDSELRLNAAMGARMVSILADRAKITVPEFMERFALQIRPFGVMVPMSRTALMQNRVRQYEADYARAIEVKDIPAAQRIVDEIQLFSGRSQQQLDPIEIKEDGTFSSLAERFGTPVIRKFAAAQLQASYQSFTYSMEMIVGNNSGSALAEMINAPLWVKMQYDAETRIAYSEPGTGVDLLAQAFGLSVTGTTIAPSAYVNQAGILEVNPSGQVALIPKASSELGQADWNGEIEVAREVAPGETWRSIVEDALYPELRSARDRVKSAKGDLKGKKGKERANLKSEIQTLETNLAALEKQLAPAVARGVKKIQRLNEVTDSKTEPSGTIKSLSRSSARLRAYALAHGILQKQEAVSGHVAIPIGENDKIEDANGISIAFGRSLSAAEIQVLFKTAQQVLGLEGVKNIGYFPTAVGYKLINFGVDPALFLQLIQNLYPLNLMPAGQGNTAYFKLNWDLGIYETNERNDGGLSLFEQKLQQSGFWSEFINVRDRIEPRSSALSTLWETRINLAKSNGGIDDDVAWQTALRQTGGTVNISRSPLAGMPMLTIGSAEDLKTILAGYVSANPEASAEQLAEESARLIRLDAYQAVEAQEQAEGRTRAQDRKKLVEQLANTALVKIQGLPFVPDAIKLSMAEISIGAAGAQQKMETVKDFLIWAESSLGNVIGKADPSNLTGDERIKVADALYYYTLARLAAKQASGVDWYLAAVQASMAIVHNIHPELRENKDLERMYKALIAITSQGQRVEQNFVYADVVYRFYQDFGKLPNLVSFGGKSKTQIENNLVKLQNLINSRGMKAAMDLFEQELTAKEVDSLYGEVLPDEGDKEKKLVSGELAKTKVRGAMMLGPKIGSFFGNLQFLFDTVTMDVWFTRTIQRILGRPFGITIGDKTGPKGKPLAEHGKQISYSGLKGSLERLMFALQEKQRKAAEATESFGPGTIRAQFEKEVETAKLNLKQGREAKKLSDKEKKTLKRAGYNAAYNLAQVEWTEEDAAVVAEIEKFLNTPSETIGDMQTQVAPMLARTLAYSEAVHRGFASDGYVKKTEYNRAAKTIDESFRKGQEAPTSGEYRNAVREIMDILRTKLKQDGIDLEQADLQAVLWYGEKDLYWMFGVADAAEGQDYAYSAAYLYAEKLNNAQRPHRDLVGHDSLAGDIQRFSSKKEDESDVEEGIGIVSFEQRVKRGRDPVLTQAAQDLVAGNITGEEYAQIVAERAPLGELNEVPIPATPSEIAYGLGDRPLRAGETTLKRDLIIQPEQVGQRIVESRLDIPAYDDRGIWVVSLHEDTGPLRTDFRGAGPIIGYTSAVHLQGVQFRTQQKASLKIAAGASKSTIATMRGDNIPHTSERIYSAAQEAMNDPAWVEVGFNPVRSSMFYRKDTGAPVTDAAEVLQVGGMVLAKNPTADDSVVRLYQLAWHYSSDLFNELSAHQASNISGLGWGLLFSDSAHLADAYRRLIAENSQNPQTSGVPYVVEIPDDNKLLNIARGFQDQPQAVKEALSSESVGNLDLASQRAIKLFRSGILTSGQALIAKLAGSQLNRGLIVGGDAMQASLILKGIGIPGRIEISPEGEASFLIWDDAAIAVMSRVQSMNSSMIAGQLIMDAQDRGLMRRKFILELSAGADSSTFMHEMMHYYLEALADLAFAENAPAEIVAEMDAVWQWWRQRPDRVRDLAYKIATMKGSLGVANAIKNLSNEEIDNAILHWRDSTPVSAAISNALHELLAENWEAYLFEGKAPTPEIQTMFQRFKRWLSKVYASITSIGLSEKNIYLTDEIKAFFDKVVASDVEIKAAEEREFIEPMYAAKPEGMSDAVWGTYKSFVEKASERAREKLGMELMASERAAARKERKEFREKITQEIRKELEQQAEYVALYMMRTGRSPDGSEPIAPLKAFKLDKGALQELVNDKAKMKRLRSLGVYSVSDGVTPDQAAEIFGFQSGQHLVDVLLSTRPLADVLKERVKKAVDEQFPSLLDNPKGLTEAASEAVRNEFREDVIAIEMAELQRVIRADKKALRRLLNSAPRPLGMIAARIIEGTEEQADAAIGILGSYRMLKQLAEQQAGQTLANMRLRDIRPAAYASAARRNAQAATKFAASGRHIEALSAKEAELANTALHRKAVELRENADKQAAWLQSRNSESAQSKLGLAGGSYQDQMNFILERFNFRPIPLSQVDRQTKLREWVQAQEARGFTVDIDDQLLDEAYRKDFREMTADELYSVWLAAKQIYHLARTKLEIKVGRERKEFKELVETLTATIGSNRKPKERPIGALSKSEKLAARIASQFGSLRKLASLVRELDGLSDGGPLYWAFMDPINQAGNKEAVMREEALLALQKVFDVYSRSERVEMTKRRVLSVNGKQFSLSKEDTLTMALNWGNETSRQRLVMSTTDWNQADVEQILGTLEKRDWDFVQSVWDMLETYWPEMEAKQKRVYGVAPERVEPAPVSTTFGVYRGGYYPLKYKGAKSEFENQADAAKAMMAGSVGASTTKRGHFKKRLEYVERPVRLGFDVLNEHLNQIIHDLTHHEMLIQTTRILRDRSVADAIETYYGQDVLVTMQNLLDQIAIGDTHGTEHGSMLYKYLRNGAQTAVMGFNLMTSLQQVFGLTQSINRVGAGALAKATTRWLTSAQGAENTVEWVYSKSQLMRLRGKTQNRELNEIYNTITPDAQKAIQTSFYYLILKGQMLADMPTWLAAYDNALNEGLSDSKAVALADQAVIDTQGGGMIKDLALAQQGGTFQRLFTLFYSYFSATYNLNVEVLKGISVNNKAEFGRALVDLLTLNSLPVAINVLVAAMIGKYGDDEDFLKRLAKEQFGFLMNQSLFTREFAGILEGRGYEGPAGLRPISDIYRLGQAISNTAEDGEVNRTLLTQLNKVAGTLFHYPAIQLQRTVEGAKALWEGTTQNPLVLLRGPTKAERGE
jgi:hypothetical protein